VISKIKGFSLYLTIILLLLSRYSYGQTAFIKHYSTKDGLPSNNCYYTLQDHKGYIWVASDAGVSRFDGKVFETFSIDDGLPDNQIIRLNEDRSGRIWFSALNGQLSYYYNGALFNEKNNKLLKLLKFNGIIVSFFEDSKGNIWFGTNKNMLVKWDGKSITKYVSANHSSQFINTFVYEDRLGRIWASSSHCLHLFNGSTFYKAAENINPISYKTALNRPDKTMLFLDGAGLNQRDGSQQKLTLKISSSLLTDNPGYFYAENTDELWLTNNSGAFYLKSDGTRTHYLPGIMTSQVIKDTRNNMWFTTNNGIYMLPRKEKRIYILDQNHGLSNNGIKSLMKDHSNRLWLGMDNGTINVLTRPGYKVSHIDIPQKNKFNMIKQLGIDSSGKTVFFSSDYGLGMFKINSKMPE
jgi:ligand-binding sensor domain-containing protein